jgi:hypothetical protein
MTSIFTRVGNGLRILGGVDMRIMVAVIVTILIAGLAITRMNLSAGVTSVAPALPDAPAPAKAADPGPKQPAPLTSSMRGTAADAAGKAHRIDVEVTASVSGKAPYVITYSFVNKGDSRLAVSKCTDAWKSKPRLVWESADGAAFAEALKAGGVDFVESDGKAALVSTKANKLEVSRGLLKVMIGDDTLSSITAPAYRAKE